MAAFLQPSNRGNKRNTRSLFCRLHMCKSRLLFCWWEHSIIMLITIISLNICSVSCLLQYSGFFFLFCYLYLLTRPLSNPFPLSSHLICLSSFHPASFIFCSLWGIKTISSLSVSRSRSLSLSLHPLLSSSLLSSHNHSIYFSSTQFHRFSLFSYAFFFTMIGIFSWCTIRLAYILADCFLLSFFLSFRWSPGQFSSL